MIVSLGGMSHSFFAALVRHIYLIQGQYIVPLQLFYDLDTELTYTCLTGFKRKGFQEAQCFFYNDSARWFGPDLECHPIDCGPPQDILNGKRLGDCTTYRCQVSDLVNE